MKTPWANMTLVQQTAACLQDAAEDIEREARKAAIADTTGGGDLSYALNKGIRHGVQQAIAMIDEAFWNEMSRN